MPQNLSYVAVKIPISLRGVGASILSDPTSWHRACSAASTGPLLARMHDFPRLVHSRGCSGSTFVGRVLFKLLELTVPEVTPAGGSCRNATHCHATCEMCQGTSWESLSAERNCFLRNALAERRQDAGELAVQRTNAAVNRCNRTWFVKAGSHTLSDGMLQELRRLRAFTVWMERENVLDRMVCEVRDCFYPTSFSFAVFPNGSRADLCFSRRRNASVKTMATLYTPSLVASLRRKLQSNRDELARVRRTWPAVARVSYERLAAFEYAAYPHALATSAREWSELLAALGVDAGGVDAVAAALRASGLARTRHQVGVHSEVVHNFAAVKRVLRASGDSSLISMIRE